MGVREAFLPVFSVVWDVNSLFANGKWALKNMDQGRGLARVVFAVLRNHEVLRALRLFRKNTED